MRQKGKKMKKVIMSLLLISIVIISNFTMTFAAVGGENASTEEENNRLFQECYEEYLAEIEKIDQQNSPQWSSGDLTEKNPGTHGFIATQALTIVSANSSKLKTFLTETRKKSLIKGSFEADIDGRSTLFKDHFYLSGNKGIMGYPLSAYDNFRNHYNGAVANYKEKRYTEAMRRLGLALHFIADINEPHHVTGKVAVLSEHTAYEKWVEKNYSSYKVSSMTTSALSAYTSKSLLTIADASAAHARGYIDQAESSATSDRQTVTNATLKRAQKDSAGVIYKFAKEVGII